MTASRSSLRFKLQQVFPAHTCADLFYTSWRPPGSILATDLKAGKQLFQQRLGVQGNKLIPQQLVHARHVACVRPEGVVHARKRQPCSVTRTMVTCSSSATLSKACRQHNLAFWQAEVHALQAKGPNAHHAPSRAHASADSIMWDESMEWM